MQSIIQFPHSTEHDRFRCWEIMQCCSVKTKDFDRLWLLFCWQRESVCMWVSYKFILHVKFIYSIKNSRNWKHFCWIHVVSLFYHLLWISTAIANALDCKICANAGKRRILNCLDWPELTDRLTTKWNLAQVHVLSMNQINVKVSLTQCFTTVARNLIHA